MPWSQSPNVVWNLGSFICWGRSSHASPTESHSSTSALRKNSQLSSVTQSCPTLCDPMDYIARQVSLSITNSWSLLKLMSVESVIPSNHLIFCRPLLLLPSIFPSIRSFQMSQFFPSGGQSIGVSASASVIPMNRQDWFPLGWTGLISLQSKGLLRVFSTSQFKSINSSALSFLYGPTLTSIHDYWKNHSFD